MNPDILLNMAIICEYLSVFMLVHYIYASTFKKLVSFLAEVSDTEAMPATSLRMLIGKSYVLNANLSKSLTLGVDLGI